MTEPRDTEQNRIPEPPAEGQTTIPEPEDPQARYNVTVKDADTLEVRPDPATPAAPEVTPAPGAPSVELPEDAEPSAPHST